MLKAAMIAILIMVVAYSALVIVNTESHGVCALMSCNPCAPLTIIKDCGVPTPAIRTFDNALVYLIMIPLILMAVMFVFRKYYLQRKDFYVVR